MRRMRTQAMAGVAVGTPIAARDDFEVELVRNQTRLFRVALLMVGSHQDAEDLTQRTLLRAWESRSSFRGNSAVYTWLYRILVNLTKDLHKSRSRASRWMLPATGDELEEPVAGDPTGEELLAERELQGKLQQALARLEPHQRELLILRHYEELSYDELASVLQCPVGTVRSRLSTARARLRQEMDGTGAAR